ncbi:hypothetical protein F4678DRAFT_464955 [Xylaria arbuscula]|nr:hypothetical protein F4678DRAFT_464955 [Xylaria arbuscula]
MWERTEVKDPDQGFAIPNTQSSIPKVGATAERDVLKEFRAFARQQRMGIDMEREKVSKAAREGIIIELKRFGANFKLPTPIPLELLGIICKDPEKQQHILEKTSREAFEVAQHKRRQQSLNVASQAQGDAGADRSNPRSKTEK